MDCAYRRDAHERYAFSSRVVVSLPCQGHRGTESTVLAWTFLRKWNTECISRRQCNQCAFCTRMHLLPSSVVISSKLKIKIAQNPPSKIFQRIDTYIMHMYICVYNRSDYRVNRTESSINSWNLYGMRVVVILHLFFVCKRGTENNINIIRILILPKCKYMYTEQRSSI